MTRVTITGITRTRITKKQDNDQSYNNRDNDYDNLENDELK